MTNMDNIAKNHPGIVKTMKAEYGKWWERVCPRASKITPPVVKQEWTKTFNRLRKPEVAPAYEIPAL